MIDNTLEMLKFKKQQMLEQIKQLEQDRTGLEDKLEYIGNRVRELARSINQLATAIKVIEEMPNEVNQPTE